MSSIISIVASALWVSLSFTSKHCCCDGPLSHVDEVEVSDITRYLLECEYDGLAHQHVPSKGDVNYLDRRVSPVSESQLPIRALALLLAARPMWQQNLKNIQCDFRSY